MPHKPLCPLCDGHEFDNAYRNSSVIYVEVEKRIICFSAKHKITTNTKCDTTVLTARCNDATISSTVSTNGATDTTTAGLKLKWNINVNKKKRLNNNLKSKFNKKQWIPSTIQPYKKIIKLLNIQGLTKVKAVELVHLFENNDILCLTETQQKIEKISFSRSIKYITYMRDAKEKKGGGLMILYKKKLPDKENRNYTQGYFSYSMSNL